MAEGKSEVAVLVARIAAEHEAARRGLTALAASASHEIIIKRMEKGAQRILQLAAEGKHDEARTLFSSEWWNEEGEK